MKKQPVIVIFDVGKTNKKVFLFNDFYQVVYEHSIQLAQVTDENGFECEDIDMLTEWIRSTTDELLTRNEFDVRAVNFSAYGASFVLLDKDLQVTLPLYNYLKPFPNQLREQFYNRYGPPERFSRQTASPALGNLNSGLQLYRLKYQSPQLFARIKFALHLPQYLSFILSGQVVSDMTSIGCHTALWDFPANHYHSWVAEEMLDTLLAPAEAADRVFPCLRYKILAGIGLHDSSAALIPYLELFDDSFVLISTGTWAISINPFNQEPLTAKELKSDCLCYLSATGEPVKASRVFAGNEHEAQAQRLAAYFSKPFEYFKHIQFDDTFMGLPECISANSDEELGTNLKESGFSGRQLMSFNSYEEAYHQLMFDIVQQQTASTNLVLLPATRNIYVDGGFSQNLIYMNLLARAYPEMQVFAAVVPQASAIGAAMAIHNKWNSRALPHDLIALKLYTPRPQAFRK